MAEVSIQMEKILLEASKEVRRAASEAQDKTAKEAKQMLRNNSPRHNPHTRKYAEGWSIKRQRTGTGIPLVTLYNRTNAPLTHLLENGHRIINAKGEGGRTRPIKHIAPVEEWAQDALPNNFAKEFNP